MELLDLRDYPLPFFDEMMPPEMLKGNYSSEVAKKWAAKIAEGDAFIIIAPEYNHGYPAVLKNALDYVFYEWNNKPVGFVGYGEVGGARSIEQLRGVVNTLQMVPVPKALHIRNVREAFDEKGELKDLTLPEHAGKLIDRVKWWGDLLKKGRAEQTA